MQFREPNYEGGANVVSLNEARRNFQAHRVSELRFMSSVREPLPEEQPVLLDKLIERYRAGAVLTVRAYMPDSEGQILRWVLLIDGEEVTDARIRIGARDGRRVMLTDGSEEIELTSWRGDTFSGPHGEPSSFVDTLGALQRRTFRLSRSSRARSSRRGRKRSKP